jgi:cell division septation protein DedD
MPQANQPVQVAPTTRIVPRHVAVNRVNTTNVQVPEGYKRVWSDGRLNPKRAEQTLAGHAAMNLIWTSTVPRRLINQATGSDVTASVPLVYPFTDYAAQQRDLGQVTIVQRNGQIVKRLVRNVRNVVSPEPTQARVATVRRQPVYSSRSAPAPRTTPRSSAAQSQPKAEVAGRGFVQVGAFADTDAAHSLAKKVQRMGMPVRVGRYTRDGQTTRLVIAGPFGDEGGVRQAVYRLRGAGYSAFAR